MRKAAGQPGDKLQLTKIPMPARMTAKEARNEQEMNRTLEGDTLVVHNTMNSVVLILFSSTHTNF